MASVGKPSTVTDAPAAPSPASSKKKSNPFGAARPREDNLKRAGKDAKALDDKIEERVEQVPSRMTAAENEKYRELADALTELRIKVEDAGSDPEAKKAAENELAAKKKEKLEFVRNLRRTKVAQPYRAKAPAAIRMQGTGQRPAQQGRRGGYSPGGSNYSSEMDMNKLYVGDLEPHVTGEMLGNFFQTFGLVQNAEICTNRYTGFSRGYGFVTLGSADQASSAIAIISQNGGSIDFQQRPVRINYANTRRRDGGAGDRGFNHPGSNSGYNRQRSGGYATNRGSPRGGARNHDDQGDVFQNFGSGSRRSGNYNQQGNYGGHDRRGYGGHFNHNNGNRGSYGNNRGYRGTGGSSDYNRRGGSSGGNWQQQQQQLKPIYGTRNGYNDEGEHADFDRMLEGDLE